MITLKSKEEIEILKEGGRRLADILQQVAELVKPGVKTATLDDVASELIRKGDDEPAFLNYRPAGSRLAFPATLCVSVNEEVVHGLPGKRVLQEGDIVSLDLGLKHKGLFTDMAITVPVGKINQEDQKLIRVASKALEVGIRAVKPGRQIGDISASIQQYVEKEGLNVVRELAGHGVGHAVHEDPFIPNYGRPGTGERLKSGMVLAIEPMVTTGSGKVVSTAEDFAFKTKGGEKSAHFEKTVAVTEKGALVLTC